MSSKEAVTRQEILKEIKDYKKEHGGRLSMGFFNNFHMRLPGGVINEFPKKILDDKFNDSRASKKLQNQTLREFLEECRQAVLEEGFTEQAVIEARNNRDDAIATDHFEEADRKFIEMLTPIYINLRLKSYKDYPDLIG